MPRRRAEREQQRQEFLDANPELIRVETRLEVVNQAAPGEDNDFGVAVQVAGAGTEVFDPETVAENEDFVLLEALPVVPIALVQAIASANPLNPDIIPDPAFLTLSEEGFGVASGVPVEGDDIEYDNFEEASVIDSGEALGLLTLPGAVEFGIEFTISGRGSASLIVVDEDDEAIFETFNAPRGAGPDDVFRLENDGNGNPLLGAVIATTGNAEISVVAVDISFSGDLGLNIA